MSKFDNLVLSVVSATCLALTIHGLAQAQFRIPNPVKVIEDGADKLRKEAKRAAESVEREAKRAEKNINRVGDQTESNLKGAYRAQRQFFSESAEELEKAGDSVDEFYDEYEKEIILTAAIATVGWAACADGCSVAISLVGLGAGATVVVYEPDDEQDPAGSETAEDVSDHDPGSAGAARQEAESPQSDSGTAPAVDPESYDWSFDSLLTVDGAASGFGDVAPTEALIEAAGRGVVVAATGATGGAPSAATGFFLTPSETAEARYNEDEELLARLDRAFDEMFDEVTGGLEFEVIPNLTEPNPDGTLSASPPANFEPPARTVEEKMWDTAGAIGTMTGETPQDVIDRAREGLKTDLENRNARRLESYGSERGESHESEADVRP